MADPTTLQSKSPPSAAPGAAPGGNYAIDHDVHILDRLAVLYRYRHMALAVFVLTTLAIMIQGYTSIQYYQATARLQIDDERSTAVPGLTMPDSTHCYEDPEPYFQTQHRILQGRDLAAGLQRSWSSRRFLSSTARPPHRRPP